MHTIITLEPESELQKKINEDICSICLVEFDNQCFKIDFRVENF